MLTWKVVISLIMAYYCMVIAAAADHYLRGQSSNNGEIHRHLSIDFESPILLGSTPKEYHEMIEMIQTYIIQLY